MSGEIEAKHDRIAQFLTEQHLDALVLGRLANFAWATGGRDGFIMIAAEHAAAHLIYTPDEKALVADRIEMPRFQNEEGLVPPEWTPVAPYWHVDRAQVVHWNTVAQGKRTGTDTDIAGARKLTGDIHACAINCCLRKSHAIARWARQRRTCSNWLPTRLRPA